MRARLDGARSCAGHFAGFRWIDELGNSMTGVGRGAGGRGRRKPRPVLLLAALAPAPASALAQCGQWISSPGVPDTNSGIRAMALWDPDGVGPEAERFVIGGSFSEIGLSSSGGLDANFIAYWDGSAWKPLGEGFDSSVHSVATYQHALYASGNMSKSGTTVVNGLARWDGQAWTPVGGATESLQGCVMTIHRDELIVAGSFTAVAGLPANRIASWNGLEWKALGDGVNGKVWALTVKDDDLYVGGFFTSAGGIGASSVARWDGRQWHALGLGLGNTVTALAVRADRVVAAGTFGAPGGGNVAEWDGAVWSGVGGGTNGQIAALLVDGTDLYACGYFTEAGGVEANHVAKWDGMTWQAIGSDLASELFLSLQPWALMKYEGDLLMAGQFVLDTTGIHLFRWDGNDWYPGLAGFFEPVYCFALHAGKLTVGSAGNKFVYPFDQLVRAWDGNNWTFPAKGLGDDFPVNGAIVSGLVEYDGNLVAVGTFETANGMPVNHVAQLSGGQWIDVGGGVTKGATLSSALFDAIVWNGELVVAGNLTAAGGQPALGVARWNGREWSDLGGGFDGLVYSLTVYDGDLIAGGAFSIAGAAAAFGVARWDGTNWSPLGTGTGSKFGVVYAMTVHEGDLIIGGSFTKSGSVTANKIARWDGSEWHPLGDGFDNNVHALATYNGSLYAGGHFYKSGQTIVSRIARWEGAAWSALESGVGGGSGLLTVSALRVFGGELMVGGGFGTAGGQVSRFFARWRGLKGDLDGSGEVNQADLGTMLANYGCSVPSNWPPCTGDIDGDGDTDQADLGILLAHYGAKCP